MTLHEAKQQAAKAGKTHVEIQPAFTSTASIRLVPLSDFGKRSHWAKDQRWSFEFNALSAHNDSGLLGIWPCR